MADYFDGSGFGSSFGNSVLPGGNALNRKIDKQRDIFLKGISSTKYGKKEDPTYLHFRFIFDFAESSKIDEQTFLPPSPLFRAMDRNTSDARDRAETRPLQPVGATGQQNITDLESREAINFGTNQDFFYGAKAVINSRAERGFFNINGGGVGYMGAQNFLYQKSVKRQQMLQAFKSGLKFINEKCPYYFQSISGLDQLLKVDIKNLHKGAGKPQRAGTLVIDCMESIDMRMFSLSELYRKAIYDYTYHRVMLPENLRKFRMWVVISEIRNIQMTYGMNDVLNPFSIPSVAQGANFLDSFNSQTGFLNDTQGLNQRSTNSGSDEDENRFGAYTLGPYAFIYQLDQCEFDFDESYPSFGSIDNKGGSAVSSKFKIHVGRVTEKKIQFNEIKDIINNDGNIKQMVLSDTWGSAGATGYNTYDYDGATGIAGVDFSSEPNPSEALARMASNFITNSVSDLVNQGVQVLQGALLGNIYGLGGVNPSSALRSVQSAVNTINGFRNNGFPNPLRDNTPQGQGLGGPSQRQYPSIDGETDVYPGVPGSSQENLGTAYSGTPGNPGSASGDVYPNNPGSDLGLPNRQYPKPGGDEYPENPGNAGGVPGRVYPSLDEDVYKNNPGSDLGLPDRQYINVSEDVYSNTPTVDTDNIGKIYPDMGINYENISEDVYNDTPTVDTDNIGKIYPEPNNTYGDINEKEYSETESEVESNIGGVYPDQINRYSQINDKVYTDQENIAEERLERVYPEDNKKYPGINDDVYKDVIKRESNIKDDVYSDVPGRDLGVPGRNYGSVNDQLYEPSIKPNTLNIGRVYTSSKNENN